MGDHAQTQFSIDNQPVTDQQSRIYSNQISPDAVQSMEIITGVAPAEYGDKSSLVVHIVTKSGLDQPKPTGSVRSGLAPLSSPSGDATSAPVRTTSAISCRSAAADGSVPRSARVRGDARHGHSASLFNRLDFTPSELDSLHLNVQWGKSCFDVPNTFDTGAGNRSIRTSRRSTLRQATHA